MVEHRPIARLIAHLVLVLGILIVAFPIYYTFIASTQTLQTILSPPLPLTPGNQFVENYGTALFSGVGQIGGVSIARLLWNTAVVATAIAVGKIIISILSVLLAVYVLGVRIFAPDQSVPGWAFLGVGMFLLSGLQLIMMGVIGTYLGRVYVETQGRPLYSLALTARGPRDGAP